MLSKAIHAKVLNKYLMNEGKSKVYNLDLGGHVQEASATVIRVSLSVHSRQELSTSVFRNPLKSPHLRQ